MMNEYSRMMDKVRLSDGKRKEILTALEKTAPRKRRMPTAAKAALAAALVCGCLLSAAAAGLPGRVYSLLTGGRATVTGGAAHLDVDPRKEPLCPAEAREGRLWFTAGGQEVDITDLVSQDTPYIYRTADPDSGETGYVIVGGTAEDFGWAEITVMGTVRFMAASDNAAETVYRWEGRSVPESQMTDGQLEAWQAVKDAGGKADVTAVYSPWLDKALGQLGFAELK